MSGKIIRPTMTMVEDIFGKYLHENETWIFNDCAIMRIKKTPRFMALIMKCMEDGTIYYGIIPDLTPANRLRETVNMLDQACENFQDLPQKAFMQKVGWDHIKQGTGYLYMWNRYMWNRYM